MKRLLFFILLLFSVLIVRANTDHPEEKIVDLINRLDYFELNRQYPQSRDSIHPAISSLAQAILDDALNRPQEACASMEYMIRNHQELGFETVVNMIVLWIQNLIKMGEYDKAAEILDPMLVSDKIKERLHPETLESFEAVGAKARALRSLPKMELVRPDEDCIIPMLEDEERIVHIDVKINGETAPFIFDTGADGPAFISEEFAEKYGFKILGDSVPVAGLLAMNYVKIGYVDSLEIGNMVFRNFWAMINSSSEIVFRDKVMARIDGVLGRYVMDAVGEFHILPDQRQIVFPIDHTAKPDGGNNMLLLNGQPFVEAESGGELLLFHLDTGGGVNLNATYYRQHQARIDSTYRQEYLGVGGIGGAKRITIYKKPELPLKIGGVECKLYDIPILTEDLKIGRRGHGMLGMDFINRFEKVVVNLKEMFVLLEEKKE